MNMKWKILILGFISVFMAGCSTVGLYYVSEKPLPEGDGIYLLKPDGTYDVDYGFRSGRYPSVNSDEQGILWVKPHSEDREVLRQTRSGTQIYQAVESY
jgi:hypothetical protein